MSKKNKLVFDRLYAMADTYEDLPWHEPDPPGLLIKALDLRNQRDQPDQPGHPGRALDIGCGAGTYSLYMASRGYAVTALDFMPQAVEMTQQRAANAGANISAEQADIKTWQAGQLFDVILDVGCLHSLAPRDRDSYIQQINTLLAPGGDFILIHCGKKGWWDYWPIGPTRVDRHHVISWFTPTLELVENISDRIDDMPLLVGRSARTEDYWFRKPA
jgi:SAM-dependent methyltransferase